MDDAAKHTVFALQPTRTTAATTTTADATIIAATMTTTAVATTIQASTTTLAESTTTVAETTTTTSVEDGGVLRRPCSQRSSAGSWWSPAPSLVDGTAPGVAAA
ncbi:MAG: hypothetical protein V1757_07590 [Actinomycetota bacterium]